MNISVAKFDIVLFQRTPPQLCPWRRGLNWMTISGPLLKSYYFLGYPSAYTMNQFIFKFNAAHAFFEEIT